ncbi:unnamed protein product [Cyprideis torosa]|uniref:Uncharacterized protein n=1 Tax=Cyprideis torosa TaxID=163714 RepID=A0A7R8W9K8_9CRUS|nr:unnamed protein product [Cyprideis torosa]CAG0884989.1 unnamed protein product [Cyprideis torosa]
MPRKRRRDFAKTALSPRSNQPSSSTSGASTSSADCSHSHAEEPCKGDTAAKSRGKGAVDAENKRSRPFANQIYQTREYEAMIEPLIDVSKEKVTSVEAASTLLQMFETMKTLTMYADPDYRTNALNLLAAIIVRLPPGEEMDPPDDILDELVRIVLERMDDREARVRVAAVRCAHRLQLEDKAASVRKEVVMFLAKRVKYTSMNIKKRTHALNVLRTEQSTVVFSAVENHLLPNWLIFFEGDLLKLMSSFDVSDGDGRKALKFMFAHFAKTDPSKVVDRLAEFVEPLPRGSSTSQTPGAASSANASVMEESIKTLRVTENDRVPLVIPPGRLDKNVAFYWLSCIEQFQEDFPESEHNFQPQTLTSLAKYVKTFIHDLPEPVPCDQALISQFLLRMGYCYGMDDEYGRKEWLETLKDLLMLPKVVDNFLDPIVPLMYKMTSPSRFSSITKMLLDTIPLMCANQVQLEVSSTCSLSVADVSQVHTGIRFGPGRARGTGVARISKIQETDRDLRMRECNLVVLINDYRDQLETHIAEKQFLLANQMNMKISEAQEELDSLRKDIENLRKKLESEEEEMQVPEASSSPRQSTRKSVANIDSMLAIRLAMQTLRVTLAQEHPNFRKFSDVEKGRHLKYSAHMESLLDTWIKPAITNPNPSIRGDAFLNLGYFCFRNSDLASQQFPLIVEVKENRNVLTQVVDNVVRILLWGRSSSSLLVRDLMVLVFHPEFQAMKEPMAIMDRFVPRFACISPANQQLLARCTVSILKSLISLSREQKTIDLKEATRNLIDLTTKAALSERTREYDSTSSHCILARSLLEFIMGDPQSVYAKHFISMLPMLELSLECQELFELRDPLRVILANDEPKTRAIILFFNSLKKTGAGYTKAREEYNRKGGFFATLTDDNVAGVNQPTTQGSSSVVNETNVSGLSAGAGVSRNISAALSSATSFEGASVESQESGEMDGKFYGRYRRFVEHFIKKSNERHSLVLEPTLDMEDVEADCQTQQPASLKKDNEQIKKERRERRIAGKRKLIVASDTHLVESDTENEIEEFSSLPSTSGEEGNIIEMIPDTSSE